MRDVSRGALLLLLRIVFSSLIQRENNLCREKKRLETPLKKRSKHEALRSKNEALKKLNLSTNDVLKP